MTSRLACLLGALTLFQPGALPALAQISLQPTALPETTAETEDWYLSGAPISWGGNLYYPAGPISHFLRNEMVRTGTYERTPLYVRTTQEPGSIVYVPLPGGLVRPYERRRAGSLAGTVGSTVPSFPIVLPSAEARPTERMLRGPAPPTGVPVGTMGFGTSAQPARTTVAPAARTPAGVAGTSGAAGGPPGEPNTTPLQSAQRPIGLNNIFLHFQNVRWFSAGAAVEFTADRFTHTGEYHGFSVFAQNDRRDVIYVSPVPGAPGLLAPYKAR